LKPGSAAFLPVLFLFLFQVVVGFAAYDHERVIAGEVLPTEAVSAARLKQIVVPNETEKVSFGLPICESLKLGRVVEIKIGAIAPSVCCFGFGRRSYSGSDDLDSIVCWLLRKVSLLKILSQAEFEQLQGLVSNCSETVRWAAS
jgi:hypothetical protein